MLFHEGEDSWELECVEAGKLDHVFALKAPVRNVDFALRLVWERSQRHWRVRSMRSEWRAVRGNGRGTDAEHELSRAPDD